MNKPRRAVPILTISEFLNQVQNESPFRIFEKCSVVNESPFVLRAHSLREGDIDDPNQWNNGDGNEVKKRDMC